MSNHIQKNQHQPDSYAIIWVLAFAMVISVMNSTMFNVALPALRQEFGLTSSQVSWVVTVYIIIYAVGSVAYGKLADMFQLKNLITFGLLIFAAGSLIGLLSTGYWMIIVGRVFQSIGASVVPASSMLIPIRCISAENRGRALGITSSGMALGTAIGPVLAGFVIGLASWRYLFLISLLVLLAVPLFRKHLPEQPGTKGHADLPGGLLLAGSIAMLLLSITGRSWMYAAVTAVVFLLFVIRIRKAPHPFVDPAIFSNARYTAGLVIGCMVLALNLCVPYLVPQLLSSVQHLSSQQTGLVMFPGALVAALLGLVGGRIADARGNRFLFTLAFLLQISAYLLLILFTGALPAVIAVLLVVLNTGLTFAQITMANTVSRTLTGRQTGVGMGVYMMASFIAGAVGTTLIGAALDRGAGAENVFSTLFIVFSIWIAVSAVLYWTVFRERSKK
ncbi:MULTISPECIES: MFS transporter [Paenibacillus]|uniref:MFS transporter n=1 Tax=Paenibacillus TaxID=44249 RepID=UPI0022B939FD|nr:MFS transporter [Paenibacillus caseinilyticus]MCZ8517899.1 MFS transporter [Paenibacillus caseinilyticus]